VGCQPNMMHRIFTAASTLLFLSMITMFVLGGRGPSLGYVQISKNSDLSFWIFGRQLYIVATPNEENYLRTDENGPPRRWNSYSARGTRWQRVPTDVPQVALPAWVVIGMTGLYPAYAVTRWVYMQHCRKQGTCVSCGYDLTGTRRGDAPSAGLKRLLASGSRTVRHSCTRHNDDMKQPRARVGASGASLIILSLLSSCDFIDPCRSQCDLLGGGCEDRPLESYEDFEATRAIWIAELEGESCDQPVPFLVTGTCNDSGLLFLYRGGGFTTAAYFFEPDSDTFVAIRATTDGISPPCNGRHYWPERVQCTEGVVGEVLCGTLLIEGEEIDS